MKHLAKIRIFADRYQFWVHDRDTNPFDTLPEFTKATIKRGWSRTSRAIAFHTTAHLNDHRLDIFLCDSNPRVNDYDRATVHPIAISSGLVVYDTEESFSIELAENNYSLIMVAYNLGKEQDPEETELEDSAFFEKFEWERYELYICPYMANREGIYM